MEWLDNNPGEANSWTRREFLGGSLAMASAAMTVPHFLNASALGVQPRNAALTSQPGVPEDRVLVVIQLSGGNDGLNTVVPFGQDAYYRVRPSIALRKDQAIELDRRNADGLGLHPALDGIKSLYDEGLASIVQGVGYPNPNRSHFKSMDIWHTADTSGTGDGWLGRYVDSQCCGYGKGESGRAEGGASASNDVQPPVAIGREAPLALRGRKTKPIAFETPDLFRWTGEQVHDKLVDPYHQIMSAQSEASASAGPGAGDSTAAFLTRTAMNAQVSSDLIREAIARRPLVSYPSTALGQQLAMVGAMIRGGLPTRVYYASHGSFDTHARQGGANGSHARLLQQFGDATRAFYNDMKAQGNDSRVMTVCFSEFGRRVGQNASGGTDHGTAAPMFLLGPMVRPGVFGNHPSLTDLEEGDLKFGTDFRSVYSDVLGNWLKADADEVLGGRFRATNLVRG
ncbi:MAG: DUF1501 domain-containing protein [Planctomycetota bacterium]